MHSEWQIFENGKEAQIQRMCGFACVVNWWNRWCRRTVGDQHIHIHTKHTHTHTPTHSVQPLLKWLPISLFSTILHLPHLRAFLNAFSSLILSYALYRLIVLIPFTYSNYALFLFPGYKKVFVGFWFSFVRLKNLFCSTTKKSIFVTHVAAFVFNLPNRNYN